MEALERESSNAQRELVRLREQVEEKDVALDRCHATATTREQATQQMKGDLATMEAQVAKLQEVRFLFFSLLFIFVCSCGLYYYESPIRSY